MAEKTQKQLIQETHDAMLVLKTKLPFMQGEIDETKKDVEVLCDSHNTLKRNFWVLVAVLVGSGILGTSVYTLLNGGLGG